MSRSDPAGARRALDVAARAEVRAAVTAGIHRLDDRGCWHARGGGICVRVGGWSFVVSAGRVLTTTGEPLWLGGGRAIVPLAGSAVLAPGPDAAPDVAALDAGFGLIAPQDADALAGDRQFLTLADIDVSDGAADDVFYTVPAPAVGAGAAGSPGYVRLRQATSADYRRFGVVPDTHLVLRPDDAAGPELPAELRGCGVWRVTRGVARDPLCGIVIRVGAGPRPCVVATHPCFTVLGMMRLVGAGLPDISSVRRPN